MNEKDKPAVIVPAPDIFMVYCPYCNTPAKTNHEHVVWTRLDLWYSDGFVCIGCDSIVDIRMDLQIEESEE